MPRNKIEDSTRINVIVANETLEIARYLAKKRGTSYSDVIRGALREYLHSEVHKELQADLKLEKLGISGASNG
jgi:Arc/MetJ-type ribon-helix-helix transcriptional regulator